MIVLDTNVISEVMRAAPDPRVLDWLNRQMRASLYLTTVTLAELGAGIHALPKGKRRDDLERRCGDFVALFDRRILGVDEAAAAQFGPIIGEARRNGVTISFQDGLIAAIARANRNAAVATRDETPFAAASLEVLNPWEAAR